MPAPFCLISPSMCFDQRLTNRSKVRIYSKWSPGDDTPGIQPKFAVSTLRPAQSFGAGALGSPSREVHKALSISSRGLCSNPPIRSTWASDTSVPFGSCWIAAGLGLMRVTDLPWKSEGDFFREDIANRQERTSTASRNVRCKAPLLAEMMSVFIRNQESLGRAVVSALGYCICTPASVGLQALSTDSVFGRRVSGSRGVWLSNQAYALSYCFAR